MDGLAVVIVAVVQTVGYILLALPALIAKKQPDPILISPARAILVSPALEELVFRGVPLLAWLYGPSQGFWALGRGWGLVLAFLSVLVFVVGHLYQSVPGERLWTIVNLGWKVMVAVLWTWVAFTTGNIAWSIFLHSMNNTVGYLIWHIQLRRWMKWMRG